MLNAVSQSQIYARNVLTVKSYAGRCFRVSHMKRKRIQGYEEIKTNSESKDIKIDVTAGPSDNLCKLDCNISRARSKVRQLVLCNDFKYFVTITFSPDKWNRYDRVKLLSSLFQYFRNYAKNRHFPPLKYVFVPEHHQEGAVHLHGVISGIAEKE